MVSLRFGSQRWIMGLRGVGLRRKDAVLTLTAVQAGLSRAHTGADRLAGWLSSPGALYGLIVFRRDDGDTWAAWPGIPCVGLVSALYGLTCIARTTCAAGVAYSSGGPLALLLLAASHGGLTIRLEGGWPGRGRRDLATRRLVLASVSVVVDAM